ncbi:hypothetical protein M0804_011454 [Polistes exclamans]|nr:hypothetical protein M0804_011454 [Polistes exclamans]
MFNRAIRDDNDNENYGGGGSGSSSSYGGNGNGGFCSSSCIAERRQVQLRTRNGNFVLLLHGFIGKEPSLNYRSSSFEVVLSISMC